MVRLIGRGLVLMTSAAVTWAVYNSPVIREILMWIGIYIAGTVATLALLLWVPMVRVILLAAIATGALGPIAGALVLVLGIWALFKPSWLDKRPGNT